MSKWTVSFVAVFVTVAILLSAFSDLTASSTVTAYILIDPGHGGEDGGTVAIDGTTEKHINLAISSRLYDLFILFGFDTAITRRTDTSIHAPNCDTTREKKVSDMRNRLTMYEQADTVISIHQNHFSAPQYAGAQVFYSAADPRSKSLAESVQSSIIHLLQPDNNRQIKKATDGIYLLHHTSRCAILVECGFLSNPTERERLKDNVYQQHLAIAVFHGYLMGR